MVYGEWDEGMGDRGRILGGGISEFAGCGGLGIW